jgi:hypothetical protein
MGGVMKGVIKLLVIMLLQKLIAKPSFSYRIHLIKK